MSIADKIEEIRQKPEHIRMRYVWVMVAISMFFIIAIWFFSLKANRVEAPLLPENFNGPGITEKFNESKESLKDVTNGLNDAMQSQPDLNK